MEPIETKLLNSGRLNEYPLFKKFCMLKEKGLRRESFKELTLFIEEANQWNDEDQMDFALWLFTLLEDSDDVHFVLVHPLEEHLLKPILSKWIEHFPSDSRPYRWHGLFLQSEESRGHLQKAWELGGSSEQLCLVKLIDFNIDSLWYSTHHLSEDLYLGDVQEDTNTIMETYELNASVQDLQVKQNVKLELQHYKELLKNWTAFTKERKEGFVQWCEEKGKNDPGVKAYYYEQ